MKKVFVTALGVCTMLSLVTIPTPVQATDFSGQEDKYMKLCSSSNLSTNNLNTCKEFNTYLKNKNTFKNRILSFLCLKSYLKEFDVMSNYRQSSVIDDFKIHSKFLSKK